MSSFEEEMAAQHPRFRDAEVAHPWDTNVFLLRLQLHSPDDTPPRIRQMDILMDGADARKLGTLLLQVADQLP